MKVRLVVQVVLAEGEKGDESWSNVVDIGHVQGEWEELRLVLVERIDGGVRRAAGLHHHGQKIPDA